MIETLHDESVMTCTICGKKCERRSANQKYCSECRAIIQKQRHDKHMDTYREHYRAYWRAYRKKYYAEHRDEIKIKRVLGR